MSTHDPVYLRRTSCHAVLSCIVVAQHFLYAHVQLINELRWVSRGSFHSYGASEDKSCVLCHPESYPTVMSPTIWAMSPISDGLHTSEYPPLRNAVHVRAYPAEPVFLQDNLSTYRPHLSRRCMLRLVTSLIYRREGEVTHDRCGPASICHHLGLG